MNSPAPLSQRLYRSFGILLALLLFLVGFSIFNFRRLATANDLNVHTYRVLLAIHQMEETIFSIDSRIRGYMTTGGPNGIKSFQKGLEQYPIHFDRLKELTLDNPEHQKNLVRLNELKTKWIVGIVEPLLTERSKIKDFNKGILLAGRTSVERRVIVDSMRDVLTRIETGERVLLTHRTAEQQRLKWWTQFTLILGGTFSTLLTFGLVSVVAKGSKRLDEANQQLLLETARTEDANRQLMASNASLEIEIGQRRAAEERLRENLIELQRSNSELEQFAYVASHDLQEPLRAVGGCVQILQKRYQGQLDARADQFIQHAVEGAQRMQNLINDLLSYSRLGTKSKSFEPVEGEKIFADVMQNISVAAKESGAQITHDPLPLFYCDGGQVEQVLQNLISNAIKFRGDKAPVVNVGCVHESAAESRNGVESWVISVADQGPGIEPQYFERVFVMFQRLHTRSEYPGTGIGLAICKKIIERHGGKIWIESEPGSGSTFSFSLPVEPRPGISPVLAPN